VTLLYRTIIEQVLTRHIGALKDYPGLHDKTVFDRQSDSYLLLREGWENSRRVHAVVVHLEIIEGKIWVQEDWIEHGITAELEEAGVPKTDIVRFSVSLRPSPHRVCGRLTAAEM